jgi:tetratricopeptide (TPR) repeat protein
MDDVGTKRSWAVGIVSVRRVRSDPGGRQNDVDVAALFDQALALFRAGHLAQAKRIARRILADDPNHAQALHLLGVALSQQGNHTEGLRFIDAARQIDGQSASIHNTRGNVLVALQRFDEAVASYDNAIALKSDFIEPFCNRGAALQELKRFDEAVTSYDNAIALRPNYAEAFCNRGLALQELKRFDEALASYDKAIALTPDYAEAFYNRGLGLQRLERFDEAVASYDKAIALKSDFAEALCNRGAALQELKRFDEAVTSYNKAIALKPDAEAFYSRGIVLQELSRFDEALASYDQAIALKPGYAEAFWNRALGKLLLGRYEEGWGDYEWRLVAKDFASRRLDLEVPTWQGEDLSGRHLLVLGEQGFGDVVQFVRYLPLLAERKCKVTFLAPAKLVRLLRRSIQPVEIVSELEAGQEIDFHVAMMSLPLRFNTLLASIPHKVPYLIAEPELEARWKAQIGVHGFKIGIAWQGNPGNKIDEGRSIPLEQFVPLSRVPGVRLISLQKQVGLDQLAGMSKDVAIESLGDAFDSGPDAFIDTAAVMINLNLVITADTSIAHLAGALGRPTWVALKQVPDWRWLLDREDCPWYPTVRLFRQARRDDWASVFARINQQIKSLFNASGT